MLYETTRKYGIASIKTWLKPAITHHSKNREWSGKATCYVHQLVFCPRHPRWLIMLSLHHDSNNAVNEFSNDIVILFMQLCYLFAAAADPSRLLALQETASGSPKDISIQCAPCRLQARPLAWNLYTSVKGFSYALLLQEQLLREGLWWTRSRPAKTNILSGRATAKKSLREGQLFL